MKTVLVNESSVAEKQIFPQPFHHPEITDDEFERDLKRAISGDEFMARMSKRIYKMFKNEI